MRVCLQGGDEFGPDCGEMDREMLGGPSAGDGILLLPAAAAPGREYRLAGENGLRYFAGLGLAARISPDPREEPARAAAAVTSAGALMLPGGSPARLLAALSPALTEAVRDLVAAGRPVVGASAGAMVLGALTWLPAEQRWQPGLGVVPGVAVRPHWRGGNLGAPPPGVALLGIPEQSGVEIGDATWRSVGRTTSAVAEAGGQWELPRQSRPRPELRP